MPRRRRRLTNRRQRPVVSDTLPFEVPASFSNRHIFDVIAKHDVHLVNGAIKWSSPDDRLDVFIRLIGGIDPSEVTTSTIVTEFEKTWHVRQLPLPNYNLVTTPVQFDICHKVAEARRLTIPHPLNQLAVAEFYNDHAPLITYFAGESPFSIRRPVSIARYSNFKDRMHEHLLTKGDLNFEEHGREYDQIGSFFVYKKYSNVFKFFESYQYHRAEKRFNAMAKVDISKCFDSIYTHTLAWALYGTRAVKDDLAGSDSTFAGKFDLLMRNLNQNETAGIVIGPEFSRIFAELILQSADRSLESKLRVEDEILHKKDYEIFRYVDDYYIFFNDREKLDIVIESLRHFLSAMKLHINPDKTKFYEKPVITEITIAKNAIASLFDDEISVSRGVVSEHAVNEDDGQVSDPADRSFKCNIDSRKLIISYKSVLKSSGVGYLDVANYTFALLEDRVDKILTEYVASDSEVRSENKMVSGLSHLMEFAFFIYASAPRVNISIRITRIISVIVKCLRSIGASLDNKHHLYKDIHDNAAHQLNKNRALQYKEIENLYLLTALSELGKEYWLDESVLRDHLRITIGDNNEYICKAGLGYFTITVVLWYIRDKKKYKKLREFLSEHAMARIELRRHYRHKDAETLMLSMDLLACPYVDQPIKDRVAAVYGFSPADVQSLRAVSSNWFTTWSGANLTEELDAKRRREVY